MIQWRKDWLEGERYERRGKNRRPPPAQPTLAKVPDDAFITRPSMGQLNELETLHNEAISARSFDDERSK
ncbi:hypothetical protein Tamer19_58860 [Cupriavidus sp. TA19]|nr:hypothetical protein Tamer19_58860 [Cupriavidus sp. TA19]